MGLRAHVKESAGEVAGLEAQGHLEMAFRTNTEDVWGFSDESIPLEQSMSGTLGA